MIILPSARMDRQPALVLHAGIHSIDIQLGRDGYEAQPVGSDVNADDGGHVYNQRVMPDGFGEVFKHAQSICLGVRMQNSQVFEGAKR